MAQYTEKAQEALVLASEAAEDMGSPVIGTEHILVGLIEEGSGTAAMVLEANEVKLDRLLALVEQLVSSYQNTATKERDGYTPSARHVLENSYKEAVRFHAPLIGTEHILMALLKESDCVAVRLLNTLNINIQKVYIDLLSAMGEDGNAGPYSPRKRGKTGSGHRQGEGDPPRDPDLKQKNKKQPVPYRRTRCRKDGCDRRSRAAHRFR